MMDGFFVGGSWGGGGRVDEWMRAMGFLGE